MTPQHQKVVLAAYTEVHLNESKRLYDWLK